MNIESQDPQYHDQILQSWTISHQFKIYLNKANTGWNQANVSKWGNMSIGGMLFQWASNIKNPIKHVGLVQSEPHLIEN
jgi:hypothetical protein